MPTDQFTPLKPPPGAWRNGTRFEAKGRWYDVNLVRWREGQLQPVGGWQRVTSSPMSAPARGGLAWRTDANTRWLALGTAYGLAIHTIDNTTDVTPTGLTPGRVTGVFGLGFGAGAYGEEAYGTERSETGLVYDATTWSLDNFGNFLLGVSSSDGRLVKWEPPATTSDPIPQATFVTEAPTNNAAVLVTAERHVVLFGVGGDPRRIEWADRESLTVWDPLATNTAGGWDLATPGKIMAAVRVRGENLILTDVDAHTMSYVGAPYVYGFQKVGSANGLLGPNAGVSLTDRYVWMGVNGFWTYDGAIRELPSEVNAYVFGDINVLQGSKVYAGHNSTFGEVWWFYPSRDSFENDRYVIWNYREGWWSYGQLARTTWVDKDVWPYAMACAPDGHVFQHEQGYTDNGATRVGQVYAETGSVQVGNGERFVEVHGLIPDGCPNVPSCTQAYFKLRRTPMDATVITKGPYTFGNYDGYTPARFSARQVEMRIEATQDAMFKLGEMRAATKPGSGR
jgi:hypothetical protein